MLMLLKRHFSGGREVEQVKLEEKTSRKKSDESVLSLREVTKYVVLTESRRPSISEYFRTLVSKMTINDALSWNSEEFVKQQYAGAWLRKYTKRAYHSWKDSWSIQEVANTAEIDGVYLV